MHKAAIIGSNGFIGRHLTEVLMQRSDVDLFLFGKNEISYFGDALPYTQLDLLDKNQVKEHFAGIPVIYYLASETIPATSWENPLLEIEKNLRTFIHFMQAVSTLNVKKVVFVSSAGTVYGPSKEAVKEDAVTNPFSPYGIIKLTMEHFLNYFRERSNIHFDIFRVSNVYGDGQNTSKGLGIINTFLEKIISEKQITIFGNGESVRNYIYVKDVAKLLSFSLDSDLSGSNIYNLSSDDTLSINSLITLMQKIVPEKFEILYKESRQSDNPAIHPDNSKILRKFPQFKFTGLEEGITKTYQHIRKSTLPI